MSDFLEECEAKTIDALLDVNDDHYGWQNQAGKPVMLATIESLRDGAALRLAERLNKADKECWYDGPVNGWCVEIDGEPWTLNLFIDAVLGLRAEPETEPDSPDASDIADLRFDASRAAEKDEN